MNLKIIIGLIIVVNLLLYFATKQIDNDPKALSELAMEQLSRGNFELAEQHLKQALELDPTRGRTYLNLGNLANLKGNYAEAVDLYHKAELNGETSAILYSNLGTALRKMGKLDEAIAAHQKAVSIAPTDSDSLNNLGIVFLEQKKYEDARVALERGLSSNPNDHALQLNLASALVGLNRFDDAIKYYDQVSNDALYKATAHCGKAAAYLKSDRQQLALSEVRYCVEADPSSKAILKKDSEFAALRDNSEFQEIVAE